MIKSLHSLLLIAVSFAYPTSALCSPAAPPPLCESVVGILVNQFVFQKPLSLTARVELRRCGEGTSEAIQIAAWESGALQPAVVIDTTDFTVIQTAARQNIYVIETSGGSRDRVYVILYKNGKPTLELQRVTKGTAKITMTLDSLDLVIPDIYAGDAPARTESYRYHLE